MNTRRQFLTSVGASAAISAIVPSAFAAWEPSDRYPEPAIQILDSGFAK